jgi:hypothetical protein
LRSGLWSLGLVAPRRALDFLGLVVIDLDRVGS